jgi:nanoRNase/pAp phosphatase (c-di-AMP/oligoRNAs hydrolase)
MDQAMEGYSKFIPYYLHPEGTYVVGLSRSKHRTKISVGTNPWTKKAASDLANIAGICERYGGGGHARVGAVSFAADREDQARAAAGEILAQLQGLD